MGQLDNTLIIYILGDNGCSAEGTLVGTINEMMSLNGVQPKFEDVIKRIDEWGLPGTTPHYAVGWAWAGDTPFQWTKQIASHFGGTRNGLIISWPKRVKDQGTKRFQFHHSIDITPTLLEVCGIAQPSIVDGVAQKKIEGVSMAYSFAKENAGLPSKRYVQYFEMFGNRAIYKDGWIACCRHGRLPWMNVGSADFRNDKWELYNIAEDFSEANDLAAKFPEKLLELKAMFFVEAAKYDVLPLDDRFIERGDVSNRPSYFYGRKTVTFYPGMIRLPEGSAPQTTNITHTITVKAEIPSGGAEGVIVCLGGDTGGWSLYLKDQKLIYHYNWFDTARYEAISKKNIPTGKVELKVEFINETKVLFGPATVKLYINGENVGEAKIERQAGRFSLESLDVGMDTLSPVSKAYKDQMPFAFTGKIDSVRFDFGGGVEQTPQQKHDLKKAMD